MRTLRMGVTTVLALATLTPVAMAAERPGISLGSAARVTPTTATLTGKVDPNGARTNYHFEYGLKAGNYTAQTVPMDAGSGTKAIGAAADIAQLAPNTVYHYRLLAANEKGTTTSGDKSFRTAKQPLALSLGATPNPVPYGSGTTLTGTLSGTGNAGQAIVVKQNPFPFTGGLQPFGNKVITDRAGNFSVALLTVPLTTQYVAQVNGKSITSPVLTVPVAVRVGTAVSRKVVKRGRRVRFSGSIRPARDGAQVAIQRRVRGKWRTVTGTITHHRSSQLSTYAKRVRITKGGAYRVWVSLQDGNYTSAAGRTIMLRTHR